MPHDLFRVHAQDVGYGNGAEKAGSTRPSSISATMTDVFPSSCKAATCRAKLSEMEISCVAK